MFKMNTQNIYKLLKRKIKMITTSCDMVLLRIVVIIIWTTQKKKYRTLLQYQIASKLMDINMSQH